MEISHDADDKNFLNSIKTGAEVLALQEALLAECEQQNFHKEKAKTRTKKYRTVKVVKTEASCIVIEDRKEQNLQKEKLDLTFISPH